MDIIQAVTGLNCKELKNGLKRLEWVGPEYPAVTYSILWKRDYVSLDEISTEETFLELWNLSAGKYQFVVTPSIGEKSEPFYLIVPETPKYTLDMVAPKCISVVCTIVVNADGYEAELCHEHSLLQTYVSHNGEFQIKYDFECGMEYMLKVYACWNGLRSEAANHYFYTDLPAATELRHMLDEKQPFKKVKFNWKTDALLKKTHLKLCDSNGKLVAEEITVERQWEFGYLLPNKWYTLKAYPNDGVRSHSSYAEISFLTAPTKPDKMVVKKYWQNGRVTFAFEIYSEYNGSFFIGMRNAHDKQDKMVLEKRPKKFTMNNLDTLLCFFRATCEFTDPVNGKQYRSDYTPLTGAIDINQ